jgi:hypothetical protein
MSNEKWQQIEILFHTALDLDAKERGEYLTRECAGDDLLHLEVESLLASFGTRDELFEQPVFETAIGLMGNFSDRQNRRLLSNRRKTRQRWNGRSLSG